MEDAQDSESHDPGQHQLFPNIPSKLVEDKRRVQCEVEVEGGRESWSNLLAPV